MDTPLDTIKRQIDEEHLLERTLVHLNARVFGFTLGCLCATGLGLATLILLLKGGPAVGKHLRLLGHYFPFYEVSWVGLPLGVMYGGVTGFLAGYLISRLYSMIALRRFGA